MEKVAIEPAMTAQEWMVVKLRRAHKPIGGKVRGYVDHEEWSEGVRHAVAAQCLYEAPFGFTLADVVMLRNLEQYAPHLVGDGAKNLADRIGALLPPEAA